MASQKKPGRSIPFKRLVASLSLAALAFLALASPAAALDINPADYFQITYQPITFDKNQVAPGEVFHTAIIGQAVCKKTIPLPVSEATITSQAIARGPNGASYVLNEGFTIDVNPFPDKAGNSYPINVPLDLQFPATASTGQYDVAWLLVEARAKISFVWTNVSDYIPPEQTMGTITVTLAATGAKGVTSSPVTTTTTTSHPLPEPAFVVPWWAFPLGVLVILAIIVTLIIVLLVRRRR